MRHREQRNVLLPAVRVHGVLDVHADGARAFVQNRELRSVIEESRHLQELSAIIRPVDKNEEVTDYAKYYRYTLLFTARQNVQPVGHNVPPLILAIRKILPFQ